MNDSEVSFNVKPVLNLFAELSPRNQNRSYKGALRAGASILVKETKRKLKSHLGKATSQKNRWNGKTLQSGIRSSVSKDGQSAKVSIMGDFRLKFFELGTQERRLRKGNHPSRGKITSLYFFRDAKNNTEKEIFDSMENLISQSIQRIVNKYSK